MQPVRNIVDIIVLIIINVLVILFIMRLDKFLTDTGYGTRKDVRHLVKGKKITVNGIIITDPSTRISEDTDIVTMDNSNVKYKKHRYYIFYKPAGVICALKDASERTVLDILPPEINRKNLIISGRLDKDTDGILLVTTDGNLSHKLLSPRYHVAKQYLVTLEESINEQFIQNLENGPIINDNGEKHKTSVSGLEIISDIQVSFSITEGKFHQVKKMILAAGNSVKHLTRTRFANLSAAGLKPGEIRELSDEEEAGLGRLVTHD